MIYEYFPVTGANDSVENYADLFTVALLNEDFQEFDSKWDEILLTVTKIPSDEILESLSEKLKTVLELFNMEIHQKKAGPDYHRLKTMVKRSIEQDLRNRTFGTTNGYYERNAVVKNQGTKQRGQRTLGDCWQWEANGQCSEGDNSSFRHDVNKRAKMTQPNPSPSSFMRQVDRNASKTRRPRGKSPSGRISRWSCKDYLKGTCTNSFCEKWHPPECVFYKSEKGCRFWEKCSYAHRMVDEQQPTERSNKNGDKSAVALLKSTRQLGCVFQDMEPPKSSSIFRKSSNILRPIRCVRFTEAVERHASIRDQNPSLGMICPGDPHQRHPNAPKFEDRRLVKTLLLNIAQYCSILLNIFQYSQYGSRMFKIAQHCSTLSKTAQGFSRLPNTTQYCLMLLNTGRCCSILLKTGQHCSILISTAQYRQRQPKTVRHC